MRSRTMWIAKGGRGQESPYSLGMGRGQATLTADGRFAGVFGHERGTRYLEERSDKRRFGANHREVRALIDEAGAIEKFPGYVDDNRGAPASRFDVDAASIGWNAGYGIFFTDELRSVAEETLDDFMNTRHARLALKDALLAQTLKHLLPEDLYSALMARWWRATDDPRWLSSELYRAEHEG